MWQSSFYTCVLLCTSSLHCGVGGGGKGMDLFYQYTELESSRELTWTCSAPASGAQLVGIGSRWREVWVGSEHRRNFGSNSGRRWLQHNGEESQDWKVHHCSTSGTQSGVCHRTLHAAMTAETTFNHSSKIKMHLPKWFHFIFLCQGFVCLFLFLLSPEMMPATVFACSYNTALEFPCFTEVLYAPLGWTNTVILHN